MKSIWYLAMARIGMGRQEADVTAAGIACVAILSAFSWWISRTS